MCTEIRRISVSYDPINASNTFSSSDCISGRVTLEVEKETKIKSFLVKAKGKASVMWTEHYGTTMFVYHDKETCFKLEHFFIQEKKSIEKDGFSLLQDQSSEMYSDVVPPGCHVYSLFKYHSSKDMPSSFKGSVGKVVYFLEAKLNRSMRLSAKDKVEFKYLSKTDMRVPDMKKAQFGNAEKNLKFLNSGSISVNASINSMKYYFGRCQSYLPCCKPNNTNL
ncbi:hypothetical protein ACEWY4_012174 [Coilia grayii]|uniref:Arrestin-like N-terminal domain-containing protein n=1 Tax=Coilia grayii TaxID=363190 RepID=A0ABD1JZT2_9TELE